MTNTQSMRGDWLIHVQGLTAGEATEVSIAVAAGSGYSTVATGPATFRLARTFRPTWATIVAIVGTPFSCFLSLLLLLVKGTQIADLIVTEERDGVKVRVSGEVSTEFLGKLDGRLRSGRINTSPGFAATSPTTTPPAPATPAPGRPLPPTGMPVPPASGGGIVIPPQPQGLTWAGRPGAEASGSVGSSPAAVPLSATGPNVPIGAARVMPMVAPPVDDDGRTVVVARAQRPAPGSLALRLSDGATIDVGNGIVIGRDPSVDGDAPAARLVQLADVSLSKSHLTIGLTTSGPWVTDRHSTNGTVLVVNGNEQVCEPGRRYQLPLGSTLRFGEQHATVVEA